jgi:hypothetical protein
MGILDQLLPCTIFSRGNTYEANFVEDKKQNEKVQSNSNTAKLQKLIKEFNKMIQPNEKGAWQQKKVTQFDRNLKEIQKTIEKNVSTF